MAKKKKKPFSLADYFGTPGDYTPEISESASMSTLAPISFGRDFNGPERKALTNFSTVDQQIDSQKTKFHFFEDPKAEDTSSPSFFDSIPKYNSSQFGSSTRGYSNYMSGSASSTGSMNSEQNKYNIEQAADQADRKRHQLENLGVDTSKVQTDDHQKNALQRLLTLLPGITGGAGIGGGLYNLTDGNPDTGFWQGFKDNEVAALGSKDIPMKSFSDTLNNLGWTGKEFEDMEGVGPFDPNLANKGLHFLTGLAGDVVTDPSTILSLGLGSAAKGLGGVANASTKAKLLEDAEVSLSKLATLTGREVTQQDIVQVAKRAASQKGLLWDSGELQGMTAHLPFTNYKKELISGENMAKLGDKTGISKVANGVRNVYDQIKPYNVLKTNRGLDEYGAVNYLNDAVNAVMYKDIKRSNKSALDINNAHLLDQTEEIKNLVPNINEQARVTDILETAPRSLEVVDKVTSPNPAYIDLRIKKINELEIYKGQLNDNIVKLNKGIEALHKTYPDHPDIPALVDKFVKEIRYFKEETKRANDAINGFQFDLQRFASKTKDIDNIADPSKLEDGLRIVNKRLEDYRANLNNHYDSNIPFKLQRGQVSQIKQAIKDLESEKELLENKLDTFNASVPETVPSDPVHATNPQLDQLLEKAKDSPLSEQVINKTEPEVNRTLFQDTMYDRLPDSSVRTPKVGDKLITSLDDTTPQELDDLAKSTMDETLEGEFRKASIASGGSGEDLDAMLAYIHENQKQLSDEMINLKNQVTKRLEKNQYKEDWLREADYRIYNNLDPLNPASIKNYGLAKGIRELKAKLRGSGDYKFIDEFGDNIPYVNVDEFKESPNVLGHLGFTPKPLKGNQDLEKSMEGVRLKTPVEQAEEGYRYFDNTDAGLNAHDPTLPQDPAHYTELKSSKVPGESNINDLLYDPRLDFGPKKYAGPELPGGFKRPQQSRIEELMGKDIDENIYDNAMSKTINSRTTRAEKTPTDPTLIDAKHQSTVEKLINQDKSKKYAKTYNISDELDNLTKTLRSVNGAKVRAEKNLEFQISQYGEDSVHAKNAKAALDATDLRVRQIQSQIDNLTQKTNISDTPLHDVAKMAQENNLEIPLPGTSTAAPAHAAIDATEDASVTAAKKELQAGMKEASVGDGELQIVRADKPLAEMTDQELVELKQAAHDTASISKMFGQPERIDAVLHDINLIDEEVSKRAGGKYDTRKIYDLLKERETTTDSAKLEQLDQEIANQDKLGRELDQGASEKPSTTRLSDSDLTRPLKDLGEQKPKTGGRGGGGKPPRDISKIINSFDHSIDYIAQEVKKVEDWSNDIDTYLKKENPDVPSELTKIITKPVLHASLENEPEAIKQVVQKVMDMAHEWGLTEKEAGLLEDTMEKYVYHVISDDAAKVIKKTQKMRQKSPEDLNILNSSNFKRKYSGTIKDINKRIEKGTNGKVKNFFENTIGRIMLERGMKHNRLMFEHNFQEQVLKTIGHEVSPETLRHVQDGWVVVYPKGEFQQIDEAAGYITKDGAEHAMKNQADKLGRSVIEDSNHILDNIKHVADNAFTMIPESEIKLIREGVKSGGIYKKGQMYAIPKAIYEDMNNIGRLVLDEDATMLGRTLDKFINLIKLNQTAIIPGFHARNAISNTFNNYLDIGAEAVNPLTHADAISVLRGKDVMIDIGEGRKVNAQELRKLAEEKGVLGRNMYEADIVQYMRDKVDLAKERSPVMKLAKKYANPLSAQWAPYETGRKIGSKIEDEAKLVNWIANLRKGHSYDSAADQVSKFLFDYSDLTDVERMFFKRVVPYYTWMRKNVPLQVEQLFKQHNLYNAIGKTKNNFENLSDQNDESNLPGFLDGWWRTDLSATNPNTNNEDPVYLNPTLPFTDLNKIPPVWNKSSMWDWTQDRAAEMNPVLKMLPELASDKGWDLGMKSPLMKNEGEMTEAPNWPGPLENLLKMLPSTKTSADNKLMVDPKVRHELRTLTSLEDYDKLTNDEEGSRKIFNILAILAGVRLSPYDQVRADYWAKRNEYDKLLQLDRTQSDLGNIPPSDQRPKYKYFK